MGDTRSIWWNGPHSNRGNYHSCKEHRQKSEQDLQCRENTQGPLDCGVPNTSGTFLLPVWVDKPYWKLLRESKLIAGYKSGAHLSTSQDWRRMETGEGMHGFSDITRVLHGKWPVVAIHFPPVLIGRGVEGWSKRVNAACRMGHCQRFAWTRPTIFTCCSRWRGVLCSRCSQASEGNLCELYNCHRSLARDIP